MYYCERRKNLELSNLEVFVFVASLIFALKGWIAWYADLLSLNRLRDQKRQRTVLFVIPIFCMTLLAGVIAKLSALTVRDDPLYLYFGFYILLGAAWVGGASLIFPFLGISARDDALERSNISAIWPIGGALLGISCSFAGANIGNGPGVEAVLLSAALSSVLFFALWFAVDVLTSMSESITVERDEAAGIRMGGFLLGIGLLSGWSVAGDWASASVTLRDFCFLLGLQYFSLQLPSLLKAFFAARIAIFPRLCLPLSRCFTSAPQSPGLRPEDFTSGDSFAGRSPAAPKRLGICSTATNVRLL